GREQAVPERHRDLRIAELGEGRHLGQQPVALGARRGEHAQLAAAHVRDQRRRGVEHDLHAAADQVGHRGPLPLYGTCVIGAPVTLLKSSAAMCGAPPLPEEAKLRLPFFAPAITSSTFLKGNSALTAMMSGNSASPDTGAKSLTGS